MVDGYLIILLIPVDGVGYYLHIQKDKDDFKFNFLENHGGIALSVQFCLCFLGYCVHVSVSFFCF